MFSVMSEWSDGQGPSVSFELVMSVDRDTIVLDDVLQTSVSGDVNDVPDDEIESIREDIERAAAGCVILTEWSLGSPYDNAYQAPETLSILLNGIAHNHPEHAAGKRIWTSPIVDVEGRVVICERRRYYLLGPADEKYLAFCKEHKVALPEGDEPISVKIIPKGA